MCLHPWLGSIFHQFLFFYSGTIRARGKVSWTASSMEDTLNYQEVQTYTKKHKALWPSE